MSISTSHAEITLDTETVDTIAVLDAEAAAPTAAPAKLTWVQSVAGMWVASYAGYYGGSIDKRDRRYVVTDTFGEHLGDFRSLDVAKDTLADRLRVMLPEVIRSAE